MCRRKVRTLENKFPRGKIGDSRRINNDDDDDNNNNNNNNAGGGGGSSVTLDLVVHLITKAIMEPCTFPHISDSHVNVFQ
jgi:hypothetical protein